MTSNGQLAAKPDASTADRRRDYLHLAILFLPLVLMAIQGDLLSGLFERLNRDGQFTPILEREAELARVKAERKAVRPAGTSAAENQQARLRTYELQKRETALELEAKSLREPVKKFKEFWNFSFVKRWPLSLLLGPLLAGLLWFSLPLADRQRAYQEALASGARRRGLALALLALAVFWLGAWLENSKDRLELANMGTVGYAAPFWMAIGPLLVYLSLAAWSAAGAYAFAGCRGLRRVWLPGILILGLMILNYLQSSYRWTAAWDTHAQWGYGYFIGPIAVFLLYYITIERSYPTYEQEGPAYITDSSVFNAPLYPAGDPAWPAESGPAATAEGGSAATATSPAATATTPAIPAPDSYRVGGLLLTCGLVLAGLLAAPWVLDKLVQAVAASAELPPKFTEVFKDLSIYAQRFIYFPLALAVVMAGLGIWQLVDRNRRWDAATRLAGLAIMLAALVFRHDSLASKISYPAEISLVLVLLGLVLACFGYRTIRVAWVPIAFLIFAIPWPERVLTAVTNVPQQWATEITVRFMNAVGYPEVYREGTKLFPGPTEADSLQVAEECSGLKILFAFVVLSIVYAYLDRRPVWRRWVVIGSALPIAVVCNFARVSAIALLYRWGYKDVTEGMQHEMFGYAMLVPAFGLLYLEMWVLDQLERLADYFTRDDEKPADGSGDKPAATPASR